MRIRGELSIWMYVCLRMLPPLHRAAHTGGVRLGGMKNTLIYLHQEGLEGEEGSLCPGPQKAGEPPGMPVHADSGEGDQARNSNWKEEGGGRGPERGFNQHREKTSEGRTTDTACGATLGGFKQVGVSGRPGSPTTRGTPAPQQKKRRRHACNRLWRRTYKRGEQLIEYRGRGASALTPDTFLRRKKS